MNPSGPRRSGIEHLLTVCSTIMREHHTMPNGILGPGTCIQGHGDEKTVEEVPAGGM